MSLAHLYPDFETLLPDAILMADTTSEALEEAQLSGFDTGYQAGWDDAVKAREGEDTKLTAEFVHTLQDLSFTYHEAFAKLSSGMRPLLSTFVTSVLPQVARDGLALQLADQINELVDGQSENMIELAVSPLRKPMLSEIIEQYDSIPFLITEDASLGDGQVHLRVNQHERDIDVDRVLSEVSASIDAFCQTPSREVHHA